MCGRYTLTATGDVLQRELNLERVHELGPRYNIAPMQVAPIVTNAHPRDLTQARWGLLPSWAKDLSMANRMLNARAETIEEKKAFAESLKKRRCLVPCDGFFEWKKVGKAKQPLHITFQSKRLMTMAGLWATWRSPEGVDVVTFTIVTTASNPLIATIHDRMPVFLDGKDRETWLSPATQDVTPFTALLHPWTGEALTMTEVSSRVNSVSVDDPGCLAPAQASQLSLL